MAIYEIHCPNCSELVRELAKEPKECPECGDEQIIALNTAVYNRSQIEDDRCAACHKDCSRCADYRSY
jgi:ribosomal protein S27AE